MKLTAEDKKHHDPDVRRACRMATVELDGVVFRDGVISADEEAGELVRYKLDDYGRKVRKPCGTQYERETLKGKVEIFLPKDVRIKAERALQ